MRAVKCMGYGPPEVLRVVDAEKPVPKDDEVLIRNRATEISPADIAFRTGKPFIARFFTGLLRPKGIPGDVLAGEVEAVGKDVSKFRKGDRVFGSSGMKIGAQAEYICLTEEDALVTMPVGLSYGDAVAFSYAGLTALPFLRDRANIRKGQKVLINGASGSIGTIAVQLAKYYEGEVTGVCSTTNLELVRSLGADNVIDYTEKDFTKDGQTYDIIFDTVGKSSYSRCKGSLKEGGIYLTTVPAMGTIIRRLRPSGPAHKRAIFAATGLRPPSEKIKDLEALKAMAEEGRLRAIIDRNYRLEQVAEAHRYVEGGHRKGDVIVTL
jgi:NADPH:quinone reductase-like Zn-dependent oxidoreductase